MNGLIGSVSTIFFIALLIIGYWRVFEKAGKPGWSIFIPIYNLYSLLKIAGKPGSWLFFFFIPFVNIITAPIAWIVIHVSITRRFGESDWLGIGMAIFPTIFAPILGLGDSVYEAPIEERATTHPQTNPNIFENEDGEYIEKVRLEDW